MMKSVMNSGIFILQKKPESSSEGIKRVFRCTCGPDFASQLSEEEYRRHCRVVIDNNGTLEETLTQTEEALRREAYE